MNFLLDTHTLIWAILMPEALSETARALFEDEDNVVYVSAASAWEIATKVRIGKMPEARELEANFMLDVVEVAGYRLRSITVEDGLRAGRLPGVHRDPFDRMIAAQALADDVAVIGRDPKLDGFGVRRVW